MVFARPDASPAQCELGFGIPPSVQASPHISLVLAFMGMTYAKLGGGTW